MAKSRASAFSLSWARKTIFQTTSEANGSDEALAGAAGGAAGPAGPAGRPEAISARRRTPRASSARAPPSSPAWANP